MSEQSRLVPADGVASASELQRDQDAWARKRHEQHGAPETTVDAVIFSLRSRGMAALNDPITRRRLSELSRPQIADVGVRLHRLRAKYPTVTDQVIIEIGKYYEAD
jgi:hypothetical protein